MAVDCKGNVFVAGYFGESADLDPTQNENWYYAGLHRMAGFITKIAKGAVPVIIADTDHNGDIDSTDLGTLVSHWLDVDCANISWCNWTDFDRNTKVDFTDFAILAEKWLSGL